MFGWLKDRFTNAGKLEKAARNAKAAANKFGTTNSRNAVRKTATDLETSAATTKQAVEMAEKNLKSTQEKCSSETTIARDKLRQAQNSHNKVKDTTYQKIQRFATLGPAGWGASRSAAVNIAQKRMRNIAETRRLAMVKIAQKQKDALDAEEKALADRKALINDALKTSHNAATEVKSMVEPLVKNKRKNNNSGNEYKNMRGTYTPPTNISTDPVELVQTPKGGGRRRRHRGRTHKRH